MSRTGALRAIAAVRVTACAEPRECENTLVLETADEGATRSIDARCTSLIVSLAHEPGVTWDASPGAEPEVLRFAQRLDFTRFGAGARIDEALAIADEHQLVGCAAGDRKRSTSVPERRGAMAARPTSWSVAAPP